MASLNILCAICSEFYKSTDIVYSTTSCGHLFHQQCLFRWLPRSSTCPQCRQTCHRSRVHRVYLNFAEPTELDNELNATAKETPEWIPLEASSAPSSVPEGAVKSGTDHEGNETYVARVYFHDDLLPANYIPTKGGAYTPWNCKAHFVTEEIELLLDRNYQWVADSNGHVPTNAIVAGYSEIGESLYIGRAQFMNITLPGKVHPSHRVLYMPYQEQEVNTKEYEVLVRIPETQM